MTIIAIVEEAFFESQERKGLSGHVKNGDSDGDANRRPPNGGNDNIPRNPYQLSRSTINDYLQHHLQKKSDLRLSRESSIDSSSSSSLQPDLKSSISSQKTVPSISISTNAPERQQSVQSQHSTNSRSSSHDSRRFQSSLSANNLTTLGSVAKPVVNSSAPIGRKDVPDHLKYLLQNVEKRSSASKNPSFSMNPILQTSAVLPRTQTNPGIIEDSSENDEDDDNSEKQNSLFPFLISRSNSTKK
jgi:hypothetical protein